MRWNGIRSGAAFALIATLVATAQQPNTSAGSLVVNNTAGPPYPVTAQVATASNATVRIQGQTNSPFVLFSSATGLVQAGSGTFAGGIVDVPLTPPPAVLLDGVANPTLYKTGPAGVYLFSVPVPPAGVIPLGPVAGLQALVVNATSPFGVTLTAATQAILTQPAVTVPSSSGTTRRWP